MEPPLLLVLQGLIERCYGMPRLVENTARFLIGDRGLRAFYGAHPEAFGAAPRARLLVRSDLRALRAALYYPDALILHLERHDPRSGLGDENIDALATLVEELDHLLTIASRAAVGRPVSLLELEHHAAVTKYLVVTHLIGRLTRRRRLSDFYRRWAQHHIFEKYVEGDDEESARYLAAARLAKRYVGCLERLAAAERHDELRAFHRRPFGEQVRLIARWS